MTDYAKLAKRLRKEACESFPKGCKKCGARGKCGSQIEHQAAKAIETLLEIHYLDQSEIVRLRRQIDYMDEKGAAHA